MRKSYTDPKINITAFVAENVIIASGVTQTVNNTLTSGTNSTLSLDGKNNISTDTVFSFGW